MCSFKHDVSCYHPYTLAAVLLSAPIQFSSAGHCQTLSQVRLPKKPEGGIEDGYSFKFDRVYKVRSQQHSMCVSCAMSDRKHLHVCWQPSAAPTVCRAMDDKRHLHGLSWVGLLACCHALFDCQAGAVFLPSSHLLSLPHYHATVLVNLCAG